MSLAEQESQNKRQYISEKMNGCLGLLWNEQSHFTGKNKTTTRFRSIIRENIKKNILYNKAESGGGPVANVRLTTTKDNP